MPVLLSAHAAASGSASALTAPVQRTDALSPASPAPETPGEIIVAARRSEPSLPDRNPFRIPNVRLSAILGPGMPPLTEGLSWRVEEHSPSDEAAARLVWSGGGSGPRLSLEPGRYHASVSYGLAENGLTFEVPPEKPVTPVVSLDAGTLHVHGAATAGGETLEDMFFILRKRGGGSRTGPHDDTKAVGRSSLPDAVFHVPSGAYELAARHGLATKTMPVKVEAGKAKPVEIVMETGEIALSAHTTADGPPLSGATFFVHERDDAGNQKEILRSRLGEPEFVLPAGEYRFEAVIGLARVSEDVRIEAGEKKRRHLVLNAGGVRLQSVRASDGEPNDRAVIYRIFDLSLKNGTDANQEIFRSTLQDPTIFLPRGRYRIESQVGRHNARQAREIEVRSGDLHNLEFRHTACDVRLRLVSRSGGDALDRVRWTLKYNGGGTVLISQDAEPSLTLQAGDYQAVAQRDGKTYTHNFETSPDTTHLIVVVAK